MKLKLSKNKISPRLTKAITPDSEFVERTKARFLSEFDARHGVPVSSFGFRFRAPAWTAAAFVIVIAGTAFGASAYADSKNVPADSPLYGLKRMRENVVLAFASPAEKVDLQAEFTARRADEIVDLESRKPSSTIIENLKTELDDDITESATVFAHATTTPPGGPEANGLVVFCAGIEQAINVSSTVIQGVFSRHGGEIEHLRGICEPEHGVTTSTDDGLNEGHGGHGDHDRNILIMNGTSTASTSKAIQKDSGRSRGSDQGDHEDDVNGGTIATSSVPVSLINIVSSTIMSTTSERGGDGGGDKNDGGHNDDGGDRSGSGNGIIASTTALVSSTITLPLGL